MKDEYSFISSKKSYIVQNNGRPASFIVLDADNWYNAIREINRAIHPEGCIALFIFHTKKFVIPVWMCYNKDARRWQALLFNANR